MRHSMTGMQVDSLDCVQFHWWDYKDKRYLDALGHLADLQREGLIRTSTAAMGYNIIFENFQGFCVPAFSFCRGAFPH